MQPLSRSLGFAALSALALTVSGSPGYADDFAENLGPVGPNEPILTTVGSKRVIAFYVPGNGHCGINVVVWDRSDASGNSAARVRVSLNPRQTVHIDSAANKSINLQCGEYAETLALVEFEQAGRSWSRPINPRSIGMSAMTSSITSPLRVQSWGALSGVTPRRDI